MSGHSKWSSIKRKKAVNDNQRGKIISKHIRAIQSAVREGGSGDASTNLPLKNALAAAKTDDVPQDNIDRAIERSLGGGEGGNFEPALYEGYGPAGVAVMIEALTDNKNRTAAEVRHVFSKHGGNMSGSTAWQFDSKGVIVVQSTDERILEVAIDLGVEDVEVDDESTTLYTAAADLYRVVDGLNEAGIETDVSQLSKFPQTETVLEPSDAAKVARFVEALEDLDDVQNVFSTMNPGDAELVG